MAMAMGKKNLRHLFEHLVSTLILGHGIGLTFSLLDSNYYLKKLTINFYLNFCSRSDATCRVEQEFCVQDYRFIFSTVCALSLLCNPALE